MPIGCAASKNKKYEAALEQLHAELIDLQHWIITNNQRVAVIFEGRDAAGKGGGSKRSKRRSTIATCVPWRWRNPMSASAGSGISS